MKNRSKNLRFLRMTWLAGAAILAATAAPFEPVEEETAASPTVQQRGKSGTQNADGVRKRVEIASAKIVEQMKAGKLSRAEGRKKLEALRKRLQQYTNAQKSDRAPQRKTDRAPQRKADRAPQRKTDRAPVRKSDPAPQRKTDRAPHRKTDRVTDRAPQRRTDAKPGRAQYSREAIARIGAAVRRDVAAGKMTPEQGRKKMESIMKQLGQRGLAARPAGRAPFGRGHQGPPAGIGRGRMGPPAGRAPFGRGHQGPPAGIGRGRMGPPAGRAPFGRGRMVPPAGRSPFGRGQQTPPMQGRERIMKAGAEIRKAIEAGKITLEQGRAKMQELMKRMGGQAGMRRAAPQSDRAPMRRGQAAKPTDQARPNERVQQIIRQVSQKVASGEMTEAEAKKVMERIKKRMSGKAAPKKSDKSDSRGTWPIPF